MSEFRKLIWLAAAFVVAGLLVSNAVAGEFAGAKLRVDTTIEETAVDDSTTTVRLPAAGDTVRFQVWLPEAAGKTTYGFNLGLDDTDSTFTNNFELAVDGTANLSTDYNGSALSGSGKTLSALLITGGTFPANGLVATVVLVAKVDVAETVTVGFDSAGTTAADANFNQDVLDVSGAVVTFVAGPKATADPMYDITAPVALLANGSVSMTLTAAGFPVGATITWTVDESASSTATVTSTPSADGSTITIKVDGPGSAVLTVSATDGTDTSNALSITLSQQDAAELASFGGELVDDRVVVTWSTVSQTNNAGWRVLRSVDGESYEPVGEFVQGAGTADALLNYTMEDAVLPAVDKVYYQLEQVDLDGSVTRSSAVEVLLGARMPLPTEFATNVYPNPFNPSTTISYDLPNEALVSIVIYDAIGQEVRRLVSEQTAAGRYRTQWDARDNQGRAVGSGVYIAKVEAGSFSSSQKMLLLK